MPPPASSTPEARPLSDATMLDQHSAHVREVEERWLPRGEEVGRYVILERVGSGGMGVVYAAYDRDLDRKVAIKLLHARRGPKKSTGQARLLREAQAMARLAHPNVVAVHEASTYQDQMFIAMEFVEGQTLGQWLEHERRPWREVVEVMRQAGLGLAAAHHQDLIHRDFKPDNVLLGEDGRARVVDFGLARSLGEATRDELPLLQLTESRDSVSLRLTETGALTGTPAYMAPEQYRGKAPDARTDQFSFCVSLWEALYGQRPFVGINRAQLAMAVCRGEIYEPTTPRGRDVPAFLRRLMRRGLSVDPAERFESMDALLDALQADPGRTRARVLMAAGAAISIATVSTLAARWSGDDDPCVAGEHRLAEVWSDPHKEAIAQAFGQVDAEFADISQKTVLAELSSYAAEWAAGYRDACEATHVRNEQSTALLDRRMACLGQRLGALEATAELLAQADRDAIAHSIRAATSLPSLNECSNAEHLMAAFARPADEQQAEQIEQLRAQVARAQALGMTGRAEDGQKELDALSPQADALGYPPLSTEVVYARGQLAAMAGHPHDALPLLHAAVDEAIATGHDAILLRAANNLVTLIGVSLSRYEEAERWGRLAAAANRRRGRMPAETIALDNTLCMMLADKGASAAALPYCTEAVELATAEYGPAHASTALAHRALGNAQYAGGDYSAAQQTYAHAAEVFAGSHGDDHPEYASLLNAQSAVCYSQGRGAECVDLFVETVEAAARSFGPEHPTVADFTNNLAIVMFDQGRIDEAETHARRSLELRQARFGDDHPGVGAAHRVLAKVSNKRGDLDDARHHADRAVTILRATRGPVHPDVLNALQIRAPIRLASGLIDEGLDDWTHASTLVEQLERPALERAKVHFSHAKAIALHRPAQRTRAMELALDAERLAGDNVLAAQVMQWRTTINRAHDRSADHAESAPSINRFDTDEVDP